MRQDQHISVVSLICLLDIELDSLCSLLDFLVALTRDVLDELVFVCISHTMKSASDVEYEVLSLHYFVCRTIVV